MSQESSFSDVQLEDPDVRKNSNPGPCSQIVKPDLFLGVFLCVSFCVVVICLMALCLIIYRECWSIKPPDVDLSRWSARHVVPHRQTDAGLSVEALQMYRCRFSNLKSFCSELFDVFIYSFPTFAFLILVCLTATWCFSQRAVFQGLSQEALSACIQSLLKASDIILKNKVGTHI